MLHRKIQIFADVVMLSHHIQQAIIRFIRIAVQYPKPLHTGDTCCFLHQFRQSGLLLPIRTIAAGILRHKDMFLHTLASKEGHFV